MDVTSYLMGRNSSGGGSTGGTSIITFNATETFISTYFGYTSHWGSNVEVTNQTDIAFLNSIKQAVEANSDTIIKLIIPIEGEEIETFIHPRKYDGEFSGFMFDFFYYTKIFQGIIDYYDNEYQLLANFYDFSADVNGANLN